jgi:hypothetical protein
MESHLPLHMTPREPDPNKGTGKKVRVMISVTEVIRSFLLSRPGLNQSPTFLRMVTHFQRSVRTILRGFASGVAILAIPMRIAEFIRQKKSTSLSVRAAGKASMIPVSLVGMEYKRSQSTRNWKR